MCKSQWWLNSGWMKPNALDSWVWQWGYIIQWMSHYLHWYLHHSHSWSCPAQPPSHAESYSWAITEHVNLNRTYSGWMIHNTVLKRASITSYFTVCNGWLSKYIRDTANIQQLQNWEGYLYIITNVALYDNVNIVVSFSNQFHDNVLSIWTSDNFELPTQYLTWNYADSIFMSKTRRWGLNQLIESCTTCVWVVVKLL